MKRSLAATLTLLVLLTGCQSHGHGNGAQAPPFHPDPAHAALVAHAHLQRCPSSLTSSVPGGLPDVTLPCLGSGPAVHLAGLRGTPTVVNIWGSWCPDCRKEMPYLDQVYDQLRPKIRVLGVDTVDSVDSALDYGTHVSPPIRYPSIVDDDKKVLLGLRFPAPPYTVFVDSGGRIVGKHPGLYANAAAFRQDIATYLHVT